MFFYNSLRNNFKTILFRIIITVGVLFSCNQIFSQKKINSSYTDDIIWENPEWENPEIFQINREKPKATFYSYKSSQKAIENSNKVAMSLSDLFCVERHKQNFLNLVKEKCLSMEKLILLSFHLHMVY